jgi:beta-N-acetylhexosaminidase
VIGTRAFSADAETAAQLVAACVSGFADSGTLCTLKHFPGHGDTATDSHLGAATTDKTLEQLQACEYLPFQAGIDAGADLVMVGHISAPEVTGDDTPASLSYELVTGQLRQALGFDGLVVTDSLSMGAITQNYAADEAAVLALQAGVDLLLMPEDLNLAMNGVLDAVADGRLSQERIDESVTRILTVKLERGILSADAVEAQ